MDKASAEVALGVTVDKVMLANVFTCTRHGQDVRQQFTLSMGPESK